MLVGLTMEDAAIDSDREFSIIESMGARIIYRRFRWTPVTRQTGRLRAGNFDGIHLQRTNGEMAVEDSLTECSGDDGVASNTPFQVIVDISGDTLHDTNIANHTFSSGEDEYVARWLEMGIAGEVEAAFMERLDDTSLIASLTSKASKDAIQQRSRDQPNELDSRLLQTSLLTIGERMITNKLLLLLLLAGTIGTAPACSLNGQSDGAPGGADAAPDPDSDSGTTSDGGKDAATDTTLDADPDSGTEDTDTNSSCGGLGEPCCSGFRCTEPDATCHEYRCESAVVWDVVAKFGVTTANAQPGTAAAIAAARDYFADNPGAAVVLQFPAGTYNFLGDGDNIDLGNEFDPADGVGLVFQGAGKEKTSFVTAPKAQAIVGHNVSHVTFRGIHFARDYLTVTQGTVLSINRSAGELTLELHPGFPTPKELWTIPGMDLQQGKYMRRYLADSPDDPRIDTENNQQSSWDPNSTREESPGVWVFGKVSKLSQYSPGDLMGIKVKHGGDSYWFCGANDVVFEDCRWTHRTRGVLRCGTSNVRFSECDIRRLPEVGGRVPFLASNEGGPQIGQPDATSTNAIVENCNFAASGDDNVALFMVNSGVIRNVISSDPFARAILLSDSPNVQLCNNTIIRGEVQGAFQTCK